MNRRDMDYWKECISEASDFCGLSLTTEQLNSLVESVGTAHDNYGMAFYAPPSTDRIGEIEREKRVMLERLECENERNRRDAELCIKKALGLRADDHISVGENGEVFLMDGRTTRVQ